jgi:hypothetical protein
MNKQDREKAKTLKEKELKTEDEVEKLLLIMEQKLKLGKWK